MFSLGRADAFAAGDLALARGRRGLLYGLPRPARRKRDLRAHGRALVALAGCCGAGLVGILPACQGDREGIG